MIDPAPPSRSIASARRAEPAPDGTLKANTVIAVITQRKPKWIDGQEVSSGSEAAPRSSSIRAKNHEKVRYSIIKNTGSETRLAKQEQMTRNSALSSLRALYFGGNSGRVGAFGEPFAIAHSDRGDPDHG